MKPSLFFPLRHGAKMPALGLGTYLMKGDALREAIDYALFLGYRHIDTAISYDNDVEIGDAIDQRVKARKIRRKDIFLVSKIQNLFQDEKDIFDRVHQSQENLKMSCLDMLLIHHPWEVLFKDNKKKNTPEAQFQLAPYVDFCQTWKTLESLHSSGDVAGIGLSNFTVNQIEKVFEMATVPPSNVQLEAHVYLQQRKLKQYCEDKDIVVSAFAPLGSPNRPSRHVSGNESVLTDPVIKDIAASYKKTPSQVLLNFLLACGIAPLPKSSSKERMLENLGSLDWSLSKHDFARIRELDRRLRFFRFRYCRGHPEYFEDEDF